MSARLENQLLKKWGGQNSSSARKFNKPLFLFFLFCFTFFLNSQLVAQAQEEPFECDFSITNEKFKEMIQEVPEISAYTATATPPANMEDIPVRFTIFRDDNGLHTNPSGSVSSTINQSILDDLIQKLNMYYPSEFNFIQCGEPLYVDNSFIKYLVGEEDGPPYPDLFPPYSYVSSAVNVYIGLNGNRGDVPNCNLGDVDCPPDNVITLSAGSTSSNSRGEVIGHEMGHYFDLLHTFGEEIQYKIPPLVTPPGETPQIDHPYEGLFEINRRELVIRTNITDDNDPRVFRIVNCATSGDLLCDTAPGCRFGPQVASFFPNPDDPDCFPTNGFPPPPNTCSSGCSSMLVNDVRQYTGNYEDYNGDVSPVQVDNMMSYFGRRSQFTSGQIDRMFNAFENAREAQNEPNLCGNLNDKVEFEETNKGLDRVHIEFEHPNEFRYCNTLTSPEVTPNNTPIGTFNGKFYANTVKAKVTKLGKGPNLEYIYDSNGDGVNDKNEWLDGVSTFDLALIQKHLIGNTPFDTGYKKLAADINKSGTITTFDIVLLKQLILGINDTLAGFTQPWLFIPEYIPQDHQAAFDTNPFEITALGMVEGLSSRYTTAEAIIPSPDGNNDKSGFDAVKIGDVNGNNSESVCEDNMDVIWASSPLSNTIPVNHGELVTVLVTGIASNNVIGFQVGLDFSSDDFELDGFEGVGILAQTEATHFNTKTKGKIHNIKTSWIDDSMNGVNFAFGGMSGGGSVGQQLFKVRLIAQQYIPDLRASLHLINDKLFVPNFYDTNGCLSSTSLELKKVANGTNLEADTGSNLGLQERLRCYPNPFTHQVKVVLDVEEATDGTLIVQDPFGKVLLQQNSHFYTGRNIITLDDFKDYPSGVFIVSVQTDEQIYSIKMLKN